MESIFKKYMMSEFGRNSSENHFFKDFNMGTGMTNFLFKRGIQANDDNIRLD